VDTDLLARIDAYMDAVPRAAAHPEDFGTMRLFVKDVAEGWPYYARPIPGAAPPTEADVRRVRDRQRALGLPEAFEWIEEIAPTFASTAARCGLQIVRHPLLAMTSPGDLRLAAATRGATVRIARPDDDHAHLAAVAMVSFDLPGTVVADQRLDEVERRQATVSPETVAYKRRRLQDGITIPAFAQLDGQVVAVGYHQPVDAMAEIVGVGTLPAFRRRGLAAAVTSVLTRDAFVRGVRTVVLSAGDDAVARVYERVGFRRVGWAGGAEPPS
jgi:ribosomal protein S18 acetylase RimI-like enzyme